MHFRMKNNLKNNRNHILKQTQPPNFSGWAQMFFLLKSSMLKKNKKIWQTSVGIIFWKKKHWQVKITSRNNSF